MILILLERLHSRNILFNNLECPDSLLVDELPNEFKILKACSFNKSYESRANSEGKHSYIVENLFKGVEKK